jgi:hypothetical protein
VLEISGGDPSFRDDDGAADPGVSAALGAFAAGQGSEHAVVTALAASRLLVPIVAAGSAGDKASEMALPTLIGLDGRRAIPAFTCADTVRAWQRDARPVPVTARAVWQAAIEDSSAVVIDVAGPVPFAVEGARLAALARGEAAPFPWADADIREIVAAVLAAHLEVASFELGPGGGDRDLAIELMPADGGAGRDAGERAASVGAEVMARLGDRLRRGVEVWLG